MIGAPRFTIKKITYHRQFTWKISEVINTAVKAGFKIDYLEEFYERPEESLNLIPNKYLLATTKKYAF